MALSNPAVAAATINVRIVIWIVPLLRNDLARRGRFPRNVRYTNIGSLYEQVIRLNGKVKCAALPWITAIVLLRLRSGLTSGLTLRWLENANRRAKSIPGLCVGNRQMRPEDGPKADWHREALCGMTSPSRVAGKPGRAAIALPRTYDQSSIVGE